jgi:hypothetical protein
MPPGGSVDIAGGMPGSAGPSIGMPALTGGPVNVPAGWQSQPGPAPNGMLVLIEVPIIGGQHSG